MEISTATEGAESGFPEGGSSSGCSGEQPCEMNLEVNSAVVGLEEEVACCCT